MTDSCDPARCPLCGGDNRCALVKANRGADDAGCWCARAVIPEAALRLVPEAARGRACLCPACAGAQDVGRARD